MLIYPLLLKIVQHNMYINLHFKEREKEFVASDKQEKAT